MSNIFESKSVANLLSKLNTCQTFPKLSCFCFLSNIPLELVFGSNKKFFKLYMLVGLMSKFKGLVTERNEALAGERTQW